MSNLKELNVEPALVLKVADPAEPVCLTPGCNKQAKWKGICSSCYGVARKLIDADKTTWDELASMGMVILGSKPFEAEFNRRKQVAINAKLEAGNA